MSWLIENVIDRSKRIDQLIRLKATGTPDELAHRLDISASTLYKHINAMKDVFGAPIKYCRDRKSYVYEEDGKLELGFKKQVP